MLRGRRPLTGSAAALLLALAVTGCTPDPAPSPTPTGFASEEEAFAAAEATYRAYVDALNQVDLSDPATFEPVYAWTTGKLNATDREGLSGYHAKNIIVVGTSQIQVLQLQEVAEDFHSVALAVCLDVSKVDLRDESGNSIVDVARADVQTLEVTLTDEESAPHGLLISNIGPRQGAPACG